MLPKSCLVAVQCGQYDLENTTTSLEAISAFANSAGEAYAAVELARPMRNTEFVKVTDDDLNAEQFPRPIAKAVVVARVARAPTAMAAGNFILLVR